MGVGWHCDIFHPHGGSWASVAARKVLLLPHWLRPLKHGLNRVTPRYHVFRQLMARQYTDRGQIMVALSQPGRTIFSDFTRWLRSGSASSTTAWTWSGFRRQARPHRLAMRRRLGVDPRTILLLMVAHNLQLKGMATLLRVPGASCGAAAAGPPGGGGRKTLRGLAADGAAAGRGRRGRIHPPGRGNLALLCRGRPLRPSHDLRHLQPGRVGSGRLRAAGGHHACQRSGRVVPRRPRCALVADPDDTQEFARRVEVLLDPAAHRAMGIAARSMAIQHNFERNVSKIVALYHEVVENRATRRAVTRCGRAGWACPSGKQSPRRSAHRWNMFPTA